MANEKYILKQDFVKNTSMCGVPFVARKQKGDVVRGLLSSNGQNLIVKFDCPNSNQRIGVNIPTNILIDKKSSIDGTESVALENKKTSIFTTKNIIMGLVGIAIVYGILKFTKSIK
jgi:hypothetical protein